jgi:Lipocalin-like domain
MKAGPPEVIGTWKVLSFNVEFRDSGEQQQPYGPKPDGYIILTPEGRMMALVAAKGRKPGLKDEQQAELFRTMLSYTGRYQLSEDKFITDVDISWNEAWSGTKQERFFEVRGDSLTITTGWFPNPNLPGGPIVRATITWERAR